MSLLPSARVAISIGCACLVGCGSGVRAVDPARRPVATASVVPLVTAEPSPPPDPKPQPSVWRVDAQLRAEMNRRGGELPLPEPRATLRPHELVPVTIQREDGYLLGEGASATASWFVKGWRRVARDLFVADVIRSDEAAPGVVLFDPWGHVVPLDADAVATADTNVGVLVAQRGDAPRVYTLAASKEALVVTRMEIPSGEVVSPAWNRDGTHVLDAAHLVLSDQSIIELPSLKKLAVLPGRVVGVAANTALATAPDATGLLRILVLDATTGEIRKELAPPSPRYESGSEGVDWALAFSARGRTVAIAEPAGVWTLDVTATPSTWRLVSKASYDGWRYPTLFAIAEDESFVCFGARGVNKVLAVTGRPAVPAGRIEVPIETRAGASRRCEITYLPAIPGISPVVTDVDPNHGMLVFPRLFDEDLRWVAAAYEAPSRDGGSSALELVIADRTGALLHRTNLSDGPEPWKQSSMLSLSIEADPFVRVVRVVGEDERSTSVDVETGKVEAPYDWDAPPPAPVSTPYCLHKDGSLTAASTCE